MSLDKCTAIIVAGGRGERMGSTVPKQFMELKGIPVLARTTAAFQNSRRITAIVMAVPAGQEDFTQIHIINKYHFTKVRKIVTGGDERYDSVYRCLQEARGSDYVFIHDGVRPFVTEEIIDRGYLVAQEYGTAVCGVPSKDTVKITDERGIVKETPLRSKVWTVQTPQVFQYDMIKKAYDLLQEFDKEGITDDAMVLEKMGSAPVRMFNGDYTNIKITTPEDMAIAEKILEMREKAGAG